MTITMRFLCTLSIALTFAAPSYCQSPDGRFTDGEKTSNFCAYRCAKKIISNHLKRPDTNKCLAICRIDEGKIVLEQTWSCIEWDRRYYLTNLLSPSEADQIFGRNLAHEGSSERIYKLCSPIRPYPWWTGQPTKDFYLDLRFENEKLKAVRVRQSILETSDWKEPVLIKDSMQLKKKPHKIEF